jgi:hypothetical protein
MISWLTLLRRPTALNLSVDAPFDPENIDEIDEKLRAFERAQQRAAEDNEPDSDHDEQYIIM